SRAARSTSATPRPSSTPTRRSVACKRGAEVLAKAGLRPGEAYALKAADLDFTAKTVVVERALDLTREVKRTKTAETRTVDLSNDLVAALRRHLFWLKRETLQSGWGEAGWLFPTEANTPLDESRVRKVFHRALGAAGLPRFRLYDLRHTFASL